MRVAIFSAGTRLDDALASLDQIWRYTNHWKGDLPTLFDVLAVELVNPRMPLALEPLHLELTPEGITRPVAAAKPNARVAVTVNAAEFMAAFVRNMTND